MTKESGVISMDTFPMSMFNHSPQTNIVFGGGGGVDHGHE